jgi:hypothetical protein
LTGEAGYSALDFAIQSQFEWMAERTKLEVGFGRDKFGTAKVFRGMDFVLSEHL